MNKIITNPPDKRPVQLQQGDILLDGPSNTFHLLCFFITPDGNKLWVVMSLEGGHYWSTPRLSAEEAAKGLVLYRRDATLTIA
jgi:hypothetical protein